MKKLQYLQILLYTNNSSKKSLPSGFCAMNWMTSAKKRIRGVKTKGIESKVIAKPSERIAPSLNLQRMGGSVSGDGKHNK